MLLSATLLIMAAAGAPAPAPETFDITIAGVSYGAEEFHRTEGPEGVVIAGHATLKIPEVGDASFSQQTKLAPDGHPVSYNLDVDAPEQKLIIRVDSTETGYTMSATSKGATQPLRSQAVDAKASVFLLDNNLPSHMDALTRHLGGLGSGEERAITVLVPQALVALAANVKRGPDGKGTLGEVAVATRSYLLTAASLAIELTARAGDGELLQTEVPAQQAILKRRGFQPETTPAAPAERRASAVDSRETRTEVKGPAAPLPATLLLPKSEGSVPAVVFLSGSGPNDQDETIGPNKPLADIARGLGDRGIASLRFDKRTFAIKDKSKLAGVTLKDEYYDDARAAIALVAANPKIDPKRIFVVGHSEGAMVAPIVAAASPETRGIVLMAAGVRPIDVMLIDQMTFGAKLTGRSAEEIAEQTRELTERFAVIRDPKKTDTPPFMGAPAAYWREFIALDVSKSARESKLPILVLQGDKDVQVRKDADFELLRARVGDGGGRVTYRSFANLNHLFMNVDHESTGAEYGIPGHVDPAVISVIADWILLR